MLDDSIEVNMERPSLRQEMVRRLAAGNGRSPARSPPTEACFLGLAHPGALPSPANSVAKDETELITSQGTYYSSGVF